MMQACTIASAPQLPASTQAESSASEAAPSSRPVAESRTRPVAESEGASTPPKEHSRIHWVAEWDIPAQAEPKKATREELALSTREESTLFLLEEKAQVNLAQGGDAKEGVWYLDSGATNHMTGDRAAFAELDTSIVGTVKFGDGSRVEICGQGTVLFICKSGEHRAITGVYYIPRLNTQIISLGQFDENGCQVLIEDGLLRVRDRERQLLVKVRREPDRMYKLTARVAQPVCLAVHAGADSAWTWHARFGHLNFDILRRLAKGGMVRGLPLVEHVNQLCDACLAGKQRRAPFSKQAKFRAKERLELVHGDLCRPITPATPSEIGRASCRERVYVLV